MGFLTRLFGLSPGDATGLSGKDANTTSKQASKAPVSIRASSTTTYGAPAANCDLQIVADPCEAQDDDEGTVFAPTPVSIASSCGSSLSRRRTAIDISPAAVQRFANKVAILESSHLRSSFGGNGGVTHAELEALYADMQLIHRGRSSMVYRAREIYTSRRVVIKAYPAAQLTPHKCSNLDRHIRALKGAMALLRPQGGVVGLERVLENSEGTFLVLQACNGGTLIEAIANAGGKLPEWQVAVKVALPVLTALAELHANGILHRDIKPEHLLIHNGNLKLGDFGSAACATAAAACAAAVRFSGCSDQAGVQDRQQQQQQALQPNQQQPEHTLQQQHVPQTPEQQLYQQVLPGQPVAFLSQHGSSIPASKLSSQNHVSSAVSMTAAAAVHRGYSSTGNCEPIDPTNFRIGSLEYMAPEMLSKPTAAEVFHMVIAKGVDEDDLPAYDTKVDIWSLGVVLYEALTGIQPFLADTAADMAAAISHKLSDVSHDDGQIAAQQQQQQQPDSFSGQQQYNMQSECISSLPRFIQKLPVSRQGKLFIAACLNPDPARRLSAQQLLQHAWLAEMQADAAAAAAQRRSLGSQNHSSNKAQHAGVAAAAPAAEVQLHCQALHSTSNLQGMCFWAGPGPAVDAPAGATTAVLPRAGTGSQEALLDQHMVQLASREHPACIDICSADPGASFHSAALLRAQTSTNLELSVQSVLRTSTLRLPSKPSLQHVYAPLADTPRNIATHS